jgi:predicted ATP-grasp superfamily ATP-dependent carboligase
VFPTNDEALAALAPHIDRLSSTYRVIAPPSEIARYFLDKELMLGVASAAGVDVPRCYGPASHSTAARPDLRFPVIVKPNVGYRFFSRFGSKLFMAHDRAELECGVARLAEANLPGQVFDFVPGPDTLIHAYSTYIDARGEPRGGLTVHKLRQSPPFFGVARVAEVVEENPALREATVEIARRIGFRGMATAEFKRDTRDGCFRFLEINGRSVLYNGLLRRAGLDVAWLAWSEHVCGRTEAARANGWPGVWIHLHADLLYSLLYRRHDAVGLRDFVAPYGRPKTYAVWSARDPLPFLTQWSRSAGAGAAALLLGKHRELLADRTRPGLTDHASSSRSRSSR